MNDLFLQILIFCFFLLWKIRPVKETPESLAEARRKIPLAKYIKLLKKRITSYEAMILEMQEKGVSVPPDVTEQLHLLKKELANIQH